MMKTKLTKAGQKKVAQGLNGLPSVIDLMAIYVKMQG
jgi:hypothetical protein